MAPPPPERGVALEVVQVEEPPNRVRLSAVARGCRLEMAAEPGRVWLQADPADPAMEGSPTACAPLDPELRSAWTSLGERAHSVLSPEPRGLVVDFYRDLPSVEAWFRHQARSEDVQRDLRGPHDARTNARLAEQMLASGSLGRYVAWLGAMGFEVTAVSIEKVEVRTSERWQRELPPSAAWGLGRERRLALPYLTWLELRPAQAP